MTMRPAPATMAERAVTVATAETPAADMGVVTAVEAVAEMVEVATAVEAAMVENTDGSAQLRHLPAMIEQP